MQVGRYPMDRQEGIVVGRYVGRQVSQARFRPAANGRYEKCKLLTTTTTTSTTTATAATTTDKFLQLQTAGLQKHAALTATEARVSFSNRT